MKKILNLLCSVILLCFLTSCDPIRNNPFDYDELVNETDRIELIWYDNPDAKEYLNIYQFNHLKIKSTFVAFYQQGVFYIFMMVVKKIKRKKVFYY